MKKITGLVILFVLVACSVSHAGRTSTNKPATWSRAVNPKPLSKNVERGLAWLAMHQHKNGGWSQGEESAAMSALSNNIQDIPNVAETSIAALALIRAGSTPKGGRYAQNVKRAVEFVCSEVEQSDEKSLSITKLQGTRVQTKLGPYIDTFLASLLLAEVKGKMPDVKSEKRAEKAADKVLDKIARNQKENGTWDERGWAPVLSQSMASKALNRAAQVGQRVSEKARVQAESYARQQYDSASGKFEGKGSAGVALYSAAGNLGAMQQSANTDIEGEKSAKEKVRTGKTEQERKEAQAVLQRIKGNREDLSSAKRAIAKNLKDKQFVSGFGSNGGEEYLSYMNIGESLVMEGGKEWREWDTSMTQNLNRIQNKDGSWTGHHCITGRTFCTAAALLALMVDRAPRPLAKDIKRR